MVMGEATIETQVAVIGGGPGGYSAAFRAADLGLEVTMIDLDGRLGGVCLFRGCIPSKILLNLTNLIYDSKQANQMGLNFDSPKIDFAGIRSWKDKVIDRLTDGLVRLSDQRDVQLLQGHAEFESASELRVSGTQTTHVKFEHAILATGSKPIALLGADFKPESRVVSSFGALDLPDIPSSLLVVGADCIGMGLSSIFAGLGSRVTVVDKKEHILPNVDRDLVRPLERRASEMFEALYLETEVTGLEEKDDRVLVKMDGDLDQSEQSFERVIVAIGRQPNTDRISLQHTGVKLDREGFVQVDEQCRTAEERIFAIGDVVGGTMFAHKAMYEGKVAAEVIAGQPAAFDARAIPVVAYSDPAVAWVGLMEADARQSGREVRVARFPWMASGRALAKDVPEGLTKIIFEPDTERILGMGICGRQAGELIAEGVLAIEMGAVASDLALPIYPHPTLAETVEESAEAFLGHPTHILPPD